MVPPAKKTSQFEFLNAWGPSTFWFFQLCEIVTPSKKRFLTFYVSEDHKYTKDQVLFYRQLFWKLVLQTTTVRPVYSKIVYCKNFVR